MVSTILSGHTLAKKGPLWGQKFEIAPLGPKTFSKLSELYCTIHTTSRTSRSL